MKRTDYVVGFMFDSGLENVALIRKRKPVWQAGLLNGIGGKVEDGELPIDAMRREFQEEAGYPDAPAWRHFCAMSGSNNDGSSFAVDFFFCIGEPHRLTSKEIEQIELVPCDRLLFEERTIGNVPWLVALAIDFAEGVHPPSDVEVRYYPKAKEVPA